MRTMIKKVLLTLLCLFVFVQPVLAANRIESIEIEAVIEKDGSLYLVQNWEGNFTEGTENYFPLNLPSFVQISELKVSDINGTFETVDSWDVDWSFAEKARKSGLNYTSDGVEVCFGISEYGHNRYAIEYKLSNVVAAYTDYDGVNFRFINDQMNTTPTDALVRIVLRDGTPLTTENAQIWAFGYEGRVEFVDGAILAYTETPLNSNSHLTVMFSLEKGLLAPSRTENESFEMVKEMAFEGSDYSYDYDTGEEISPILAIIISFLSFIVPIGLVIFLISNGKKKRLKEMKNFTERFGYFRDLPNEGNTNATYALGRLFELCEDGAILATGMLRLIDIGCLQPLTQESVGFFGKTKEEVNIELLGSKHELMNEFDEYLYTVIESAAGADGILQAKELERFAAKNDKVVRTYLSKCEAAGQKYLSSKRCLNRKEIPARLRDLTPNGEQELGELLGFKKYLEDFSLIAERGIKELPIWKELLSYAMLFGIADKLIEQMKELYPNLSAELTTYSRNIYTAGSYHYLLYRNMRSAEAAREQKRRSSGGGGFSSFGGGGGSFGGGSGGGSR